MSRCNECGNKRCTCEEDSETAYDTLDVLHSINEKLGKIIKLLEKWKSIKRKKSQKKKLSSSKTNKQSKKSMSQETISELLKKIYPKSLNYEEISKITGLTLSTVSANLRRLRKRDEVEFTIKKSKSVKATWISYYRIKK